MSKDLQPSLAPRELVSPGVEAIYTGREFTADRDSWPSRITSDGKGREILEWPLWPWYWPEHEQRCQQIEQRINALQQALEPLNDEQRKLRAHIASLVPCDNGVPVTIDELLDAIGRGALREPSFHNGCMIPTPWWEGHTTQPRQVESMQAIEAVLRSYLAGESEAELAARFPQARGFITRTFEWFGPRAEFTAIQQLMLERALLPFEYLAKHTQQAESVYADCFKPGGRGEKLDHQIAAAAGLPPIAINDYAKFKENYDALDDEVRQQLYRVCCRIAGGVSELSDCHHNTFRMIESWVHGIGYASPEVPTRQAGAERERIGRLLFGYVLGLDRWLADAPLQFLLLDLGHLSLPADPRNEILRVFAWLGEPSAEKRWLAACLWLNLHYNRPAGLVRHQDLLEQAKAQDLALDTWLSDAE